MHHFLVGVFSRQISLCRNFHSKVGVGVISDVGVISVEYGTTFYFVLHISSSEHACASSGVKHNVGFHTILIDNSCKGLESRLIKNLPVNVFHGLPCREFNLLYRFGGPFVFWNCLSGFFMTSFSGPDTSFVRYAQCFRLYKINIRYQ